jgi:hypothetical protein
MMKLPVLILLLTIPPALVAQSPEKLISEGKYDMAIEKCVQRLSDGKGNKHELYAALKHSYEKANEQDLERILALKATKQPDIWYEVFMNNFSINERFKKVSVIRQQLLDDQVNIQLLDNSSELEASREHAAAYLYAHAGELLKTGSREDAAMAYAELRKITKLYKEFKDVELMMRRALGASAGVALLEVRNLSGASLPPDFLADMENIVLSHAEKQYLDYTAKALPGQEYSLKLVIEIASLEVTPGTVSEKEYTSSHKDPESFADLYEDQEKREEDKKHPDYNKCRIKEIFQLKTAVMQGRLRYVDAVSGKVLYIVPVTARSVFENKTATASGDMFACPPEVIEILDKPRKKFPSNAEMIYNAGEEFKQLVKGIVWDESFIGR